MLRIAIIGSFGPQDTLGVEPTDVVPVAKLDQPSLDAGESSGLTHAVRIHTPACAAGAPSIAAPVPSSITSTKAPMDLVFSR
jgi:hypothetical protein